MSNTLLPTVALAGRLTPFHVIRTSEVKVEPSECFKITEKGKEFYALGKPALAKIAQAAGISWDAEKTGVVGQPTADYVMYRAVARMSMPDGQLVTGIGTTEWIAEEEVEPIKKRIAEAQAKGDTQKVFGLTKALSKEVASRGVTVNAVAPGFIGTEILRAMPEKVLQGMVDRTPLGRMGEPRDVAEAYCWLASDAASFVSGAVLSVDGGLVM